MLWCYFDETGIDAPLGASTKFEHMLVGGCISTRVRWRRFEEQWQAALEKEGVACFHGKEFYSYNGEFRWFRDGRPDTQRHEAFRDNLAQIILDNVHGMVGFFGGTKEGRKAVIKSYTECVEYALRDLSRSTDEKNSVVITLARRPDVSPWRLLDIFSNHNWDGRLAGCGVFRPEDVLPLQASDFVMHAMNSRWRDAPNAAFNILRDGARERGLHMSLSLRGAPSSPDVAEVSGRIGIARSRPS